MTKVLEIESCYSCFWFHKGYLNYQLSFLCTKKRKKMESYEPRKFPQWCPLPDKPEPITYQKIYEKMLEIGFLNPTTEKARQLSEAINAHFGTRRRNEPITGNWLEEQWKNIIEEMIYSNVVKKLEISQKLILLKLAERINKKREVNDGNN